MLNKVQKVCCGDIVSEISYSNNGSVWHGLGDMFKRYNLDVADTIFITTTEGKEATMRIFRNTGSEINYERRNMGLNCITYDWFMDDIFYYPSDSGSSLAISHYNETLLVAIMIIKSWNCRRRRYCSSRRYYQHFWQFIRWGKCGRANVIFFKTSPLSCRSQIPWTGRNLFQTIFLSSTNSITCSIY